MNNYNQFLNPGSNASPNQNLPGQTVGGSGGQSGGNQSGAFTPAQMTGDANKDAILQLYNKYGISPGAKGSGLTDLDYWAGDAMQHASGDKNYVLGRLESDLKGSGPDAGGGGGGNLSGNNYGNAISSALGGYQDFSQNGGFSPQNIQDLRARAIAPTRAIYENAQNNIDRQRALNSGYSPNYTAASAKLARDESNQISDANVNANASIAQLVQQGKLYGLSGLSSTGMGARGQNLGAMGQQSQLYGTNPGLTQTFGNQVLQSGNQGIQLGGLQNQLGLGIMQNQNQHANIPGNFQSGLGNVASILGLVGQAGNLFGLGKNLFGGGGMYPTGGAGGVFQPSDQNGWG